MTYSGGSTLTVKAQNKVVVIPLLDESTGPPGQLPKTGQTVSDATGDDGDLKKGTAWPNPRFINNGNGTVTDKLTGLIWLNNGNCEEFFAGDSLASSSRSWADTITACNKLSAGFCSLNDGSKAGDWRVGNIKELYSLIDHGQPTVPINILHENWSSTTRVNSSTSEALTVDFSVVGVVHSQNKTSPSG